MIPLSERLILNIEEQRRLMAEYNGLESEDAKKGVRASVYKKTGNFGKAVMPLNVRYAEIEEELAKRNKA